MYFWWNLMRVVFPWRTIPITRCICQYFEQRLIRSPTKAERNCPSWIRIKEVKFLNSRTSLQSNWAPLVTQKKKVGLHLMDSWLSELSFALSSFHFFPFYDPKDALIGESRNITSIIKDMALVSKAGESTIVFFVCHTVLITGVECLSTWTFVNNNNVSPLLICANKAL